MWYEAIPSFIAMGACMTLIELGPFVTHYISWGCPMMRFHQGEISTTLVRRDARIAEEEHKIKKLAPHMYTFGLSGVKDEVKKSGNYSQYAEAEKKFLSEESK